MAAVLVALFLLPRELLKSLGDDRGDRVSGWRTAAVVWGRRTTLVAITLTSMLFAAGTLTPMLVGMGSGIYFAGIWLGTTLPLLGVVTALWRRPNLELRRAEFLTGLMWLPGLAALWQLAPAG
jgi:4-hydroxybenzoate polyprenyltransferase